MTPTSIIPQLDDITFDELVEDGRGLIPRYAPEWTDHNLHDPGITLIDLIAYLADQQVYRIGVVGDSLKAAFTRLMGVHEEGPEGAKLLIWPTPESSFLDMLAGTSIDSPDLPDAAFTLDADIRMVAAKIDELTLVSDEVRKDLGIGLTEGRDPVVIWPFSGGGPRSIEIKLKQEVIYQADSGLISLGIAFKDPPPPEETPGAPVVVEQYDPAGFWRPLETDDRTGGLRKTGPVLFRPLEAPALRRFRLRLDQGFRAAPVTITRLAMNVLPATEGVDVDETRIGEGTDQPDQEVLLQTDDVVERDGMAIRSTSADRFLDWQIVPDFESSRPDDLHVVLTPTGLLFGNGLNGRTVPLGATILHLPLRRTCGAEGAVAGGLIWRRSGQVLGKNIAPSTPGKNRDTLRDLLRKARAVAEGRQGLLQADVIADRLIAAELGLAVVQVMEQRWPGLDDVETPGNRTVLVIPTRDPDKPPPPANSALLGVVEQLLEPARLLGERLHVSLPIYREVDVSVAVLIEADADAEGIAEQAETLIRQRLWDLPRHSGAEVRPWQAGRPVTTGEIATLISDIAPVVRVTDCRIGRDGALGGDAIALSDREIALARAVSVTIERAVEGEVS